MADIVARKLVENGQGRILQRLFDGVTSNLTLDVSDYKESDEHKLLHLVWRKYPRKRSPAYGQKLTTVNWDGTSNFAQTTEMNISSPIPTFVDPNVRLFPTPPVNSAQPNVICPPAVEKGPSQKGELDNLDDSGPFISSCPKGRKNWYSKSQTTPLKLFNRFDCLENEDRPENSHTNFGSSDLRSIDSSRKSRHRGSSGALKSQTQLSISPKSSNSDLTDNGSIEGSQHSSEPIKNIGTLKSFNFGAAPWEPRGYITTSTLEDIPYRSRVTIGPVGSSVSYILEYDESGKPFATYVTPITDYEESSTGHQSDTYD